MDKEEPVFDWDIHTWATLDSYFGQGRVLTEHQTESFNNFVDFIIPQIIEKNNPVVIATDYDSRYKVFQRVVEVEFMQTYLSKPLIHEINDTIKPLYPNEARLRGLTYSAPMFIDIKHTITTIDPSKGGPPQTKTQIETKIPLMKLPIMLHSKYCHLSDHNESTLSEVGECEYDQGGYFIVNGGEKVLVSQERVAENQVFVWNPPKTSTSKYTHEAEIKSSIDQRFYPIKTIKVKLTKEPSMKAISECKKQGSICGRTFHVQMPYLKEDIPLFIIFRALGVATEKEMFEMIFPNLETIGTNYTNLLVASVDDARFKGVTTQRMALEYLSNRLNLTFNKEFKAENEDCQIKYVMEVLNRELFPHIGQIVPNVGQSFRKKAFFLGHMTRKLIDCYSGVRPYDDRDHYGNKRVNLAGPLLTDLFRANFIKLIRDIRKKILPILGEGGSDKSEKIGQTLSKLIKGCNIDSKIKFGLATGNWSTQKGGLSSSKKGIAQVLNRMSFAGALSHTRRIMSPLERSGSKIVAPRRLHGTHFGMCCPNETPEGQQIGIVKNLAMQTHVTIQTNDYPIRIVLNKLGVVDLIETVASDVQYCTKVFVNGDWFGVMRDQHEGRDLVYELYRRLKTLKRHGIIVPYISIAWFIPWKEIHIQTDGGRYSRPVYIVEDGQLLIEKLYQEDPIFRQHLKEGKVKWSHFLTGFHEGHTLTPGESTLTNGGVVEYQDTNEIENAMIAMTYGDLRTNTPTNSHYVRYSHCEIHPMMMLGIVSAMTPFSDHNQSPRNCYQASMAKQSIGYYVTNYNSRMDTMTHVLVYGHKPLVTTRAGRYTLMDNLPHGGTAMLLYACYTG